MMNVERVSPTVDRIALLEDSVKRLYAQNRRLRLILYGAVAAFCCAGVLGMTAVNAQDSGANVVAQRVTLVDANKNVLMELGSFDKGMGLVVYGANGAKSVLLGVSSQDKSPGLVMLDNDGTPRIGVGLQGSVPGIALSDGKGQTRLGIGVGKDNRYGFVAYDANQVERAGIGLGQNGPFCVLLDDKGKPLIGMSQGADGNFGMAHIADSAAEVPIQ